MVRNRNLRRFSSLRIHTLLTCAVAGVSVFAQRVMADISKAGNSNNLNLGSSWVGGVTPGATDVAVFDSNMGSFTNFSLGDSLGVWRGIRVTNPSVGVTILAGNNLTLGSAGIDTSSASNALTLNNNLVLSGSGQTWNIGSGGLNLGGATNLSGGTVSLTGFGTTVITGPMSGGSFVITGGNVSMSGSDNLAQIVASNSGYTTSLSGTRTVGTVALYGGNANIYSAGALGGGALILGGVTFDNLAGSPLTVNGAVTLSGDNTTFTGSGNLNITSQITLGATSTLTLSAGTTTMSGGLSAVAGRRFLKDGPGLLVFSGTGNLAGALTLIAGTMTITGSLTAGGGVTQVGGSTSTPGVIDLNGGTLNSTQTGFPSIRVGVQAVAGSAGAIHIHNNGALLTSGQLALGNDPGQYAALSISSGTLVAAGSGLAVGGYNGNGILTMTGGAGSVTGQTIWIAGGGTATSTGAGIVNLTGGTLNSAANDSAEVGQYGYGVLNISGSAWLNASGSITIGVNAAASGQVNLNGGTLTTTLIRSPQAQVTYFNFNGGTLTKTGTQTAFLGASGALLDNAAIWSGGAIINDSGSVANILQPLMAPTGSGVSSIPLSSTGAGYIDAPLIVITGGGGFGATAVANIDANGNVTGITVTNRGQGYTSAPSVTINGVATNTASPGTPVLSDNTVLAAGGLTKLGAGTVVLQAQSTYAGATTVNAGVLRLDFATAASVAADLINPVSALKLNGGNLTVVGITGTANHSQTFAGTTIGSGAASGVSNFAANATSPIVVNLGVLAHLAGAYADFNSTSGAQTAANGITTTNAPGLIGGWATFLASGTAATWAVVGADPANPTNITGMTSGFSTSLTAAANVDLPAGSYTTGALTINSLRMTDIASGYTLDAGGGLVISDGGLMLTSADTNSGHAVLIQGGSVGVGSGKDLVVIQSNTVNAMTISSALVLGSNSLIKAGNGLLDLTGTASFTGQVFVYGGTLGLSDASELGANPGSLVANQLTLTGALRFDASMNMGNNRGVTLGANAVIDTQAFNATMGAVTSGVNVFGLTKLGTGELNLAGSANSFTGNLIVRNGTLGLQGSLPLAPASAVTVGDTANTPAVLAVNGGTLNTTASILMDTTASSMGVIILNSGVITTGAALQTGWGPNAADTNASSYGAILINGGTLAAGSNVNFGRGQAANSAGVALLQVTGGTLSVGGGFSLTIGALNGVSNRLHGVAVLSGGTIIGTGPMNIGDNATPGIANFLGTNATATALNFTGAGTAVSSVANLNGGNLTVGAVNLNTGGVLNFNGGTLTARTGSTTLVGNNANGRAYVWTGGAIFDSNGTSSTIAQPLLAPDVQGLSGFSGLVNASASVTSATVTLTGGLPASGYTASAAAVAIIANGSITGFQITNPGYGYTSAPTLAITSNGGTASATVNMSTLLGVSLSLAAANFTGGTGYVAPPVVSILPAANGTISGSGTGASAYATIDASGNLTGIVLTNPGVGYTAITNGTSTFFPTISVVGGGGTGATIGQLSMFSLVSGGGVTKNGAGTLTFSSSTSNFTGPTNVNAGTMVVSGTFNGAGAVTVANAAVLSITGKVSGAITTVNGGILSMGPGGLAGSSVQINSGGTLTVPGSATIAGAVTVDGGGVIDMTGGTPGTLSILGGLTIGSINAPTILRLDLGTASDTLAASTFTINGTNSTPITLNIGNPAPNTVYTLASFSTSTNLTGLVNLTANSTRSGFVSIDLQTPNGAITVTTHGKVQPPDAYWTGQYGAGWNSLDGSGTNSNFNDSPTINSNANQWPGTASNVDFVTTVSPAPQNLLNFLGIDFSVKSVQVKSGMGAVTISNSTSGVQTLTLGVGGLVNESGAGGLTINSNVGLGTAQTWSNLDATSLITVNGTISGTGLLSIAGVVAMNGISTYSGGTIIANGTVTAGSSGALGVGTVTMGANGRLQLNGSALTIGGLASTDPGAIIENNGANPGTLTLNTLAGGNNAYAGILQDGTSSTLSLRVTGNGSVTLSSSNSITGTMAVGTGTAIISSGGVLNVNTNLVTVGDVASTLGTLVVNGGTLNANRGATTPAIIIGSGANSRGAVVLNSGVMTFSNESFFAYGPNAADGAATSYGALVVTGGTLTHSNFLGLSRGQAANSGGVAILQMTGGLIDGSASANPLQIGAYQGTAGLLHGVAVLQGGNIVEQVIAVGDFVNGVANMLGTNVTANTTTLGRNGGNGILNLDAGTLTSLINWNAASTLNLAGGTIRVPSNNSTLIANSANGQVYLHGAGAIIDSNSFNTTIAQALLTPASLKVSSVTITNGGTGFTSAPTLTLSGGGGTGATATAVVNTTNGSIGTITITNAGVGYTSAPTITVSGPTGSGGFVLAPVMGATQGLSAISVSAGGTGYLNAPPVLEITGGGGTGATAIANVSANGVITSITVTNPGIGYTTQPTVTIRGGGGTGFAIGTRTLADSVGGGLTLNGGGTLTLSSTVNTYSGNTVLNAGKMNLTGASTGSPTWNLNNASILNVTGTLNAPTAINVGSAAIMTSTGVVSTGTLNASGLVNAGGTFSAATAINVLSGGTFNANGSASAPAIIVSGGAALGGIGTLAGPVTIAGGPDSASRGTLNTVDGVAGTLNLAGVLTVGGGGLSTFKFDITDRVNLGSNPLVSNAGATIFLNGSGTEQVGNVYTLMTYNNTASPTLALSTTFMGFDTVSFNVSNSSASVTILTVPAAPAAAYFSNNRADGVWNTVLSGGLSNWNTDASSNVGVTQLPGATTDVFLVTSNPSVTNLNMSLGQDFQVKSLHALSSTGAATLSGVNTLTVGSGGITLDSGQGGLTVNAKLSVSANQTWTINGLSPLTVNGAFGSTGNVSLVKEGSSPLILNGDNTFAGSLTLNAGTVALGSATALGNGSTSFYFGAGSGAHLQLLGVNVQIGALQGDSSAVIENTGAQGATLTAGAAVDSTFAGIIQDGAAAISLVKSGTGGLTLTNLLTYSGATTVRQGRLIVGGQITSGTSSQFTVGDTAGLDAELDVTNGTISAAKTTAPAILISSVAGASGVLRINGGTVTAASELHVGGNAVGAAGAYAALDMAGGSNLSVDSWLAIGYNNDRSVFNMSGGTLTINANSITVAGGSAASPNAFGVMNVSGGTILTNNTASVSMYVGESGTGALNVSGNANLALSGSLTFARLTAGNGVVNLSGGTLTAAAVTMASAGASEFNFKGGTLAASAAPATAFMSGLSSAYIWSGSANINDNGSAITIGQNLLAPTGNGVASIAVSGATGFTDTPVVIISGGGGTGATAVANVDTAGNLTGISITNPGVNYTASPTVTVFGGGVHAGNSTAGTTVGTVALVSNAGLSGGLNKFGTGVLTLTGNSTYVGPTTVNGGGLSISSNANLGASGVLNLNAATLYTTASVTLDNAGADKRNIVVTGGVTFDTVSTANTLTVTGNISGAGSIALINGGKMNMNGTSSVPIVVTGFNSTRLGGTGVVTAPVTIDNNNEINLLSGNVGTLTLSGGLSTTGFQNAFRFDLGGVAVGAVDRVSLGSSTLTLGSSNVTVYLNNLGVNPGTYTLMSYAALATSGGSLTLDFASQALGASTATISQTSTALLLTVAGAPIPSTAYWSGSQSSGAWNTVNSGSLTNFNTSVNGGIDTHQTPGAITNVFFATTSPAQNGPLSTSLGADMAVHSLTVISAMTSSVSISGNTLSVGDGGLNMQAGAGALTVSSNVALLADQTWTNANTASTLTANGLISGNQNLALAGKISIGGFSPNTFVGNVGINSGKITLGGTGGLGDPGNRVIFAPASNATLDLSTFATTVGGLQGDSTATVTGSGTLTIAAVGTPNFGGALNGALVLTVAASNAGPQTLSGTSSYSGTTTINAGAVLKNGSATALSPNSSLAGAGELDMGGFDGAVATITGTLNVTNSGAGTATLTIAGNTTTTFTGTFNNGNSPLGVIKNGSGDLILLGQSMANTGGLTINGGTVWPTNNNFGFTFASEGQIINSLGAAGNTVTLNTGGTLHGLGAGNNGGLLQVDWYMPNSFVFAGGTYYHQDGAMPHLGSDGQGNTYAIRFDGTGSVLETVWNTKTPYIDGYLTGAGTVTLLNAGGGSRAESIFTNTSTQNTFSGQVNIDTATALGTNLYLAGGTTMTTFGLATIDTGLGGTAQTMTNAVVFVSLTSTVQSTLSTLTGAAPIAVSFGALQGNGNFTLANQTNGALGVTLTVGGKNVATTFSGVMSGIGALVVSGGTLALTGANTYTGGTTLNGGVLTLGNAAAIGTSGTILFGGGTLQHSASNALDLSSRFSTAAGQAFRVDTNGQNVSYASPLTSAGGSITKLGAGTLHVVPTGNYGAVSVNQGTLALNATAGARQTSAVLTQIDSVSLAAGTTLDLTNHDLLIHGGSAAAVESLIGSSYFFGLWNKPGITSSSAQANPITTLGIMSGADYNTYSSTPGVFDGAPVANTDIVVKYTYSGDINLDGLVNDDDFGLFSGAYFFTGVGNYALGDLNFDGLVNDDDFGVFSGNYFFTPPSPLGGLGDTSLASASATGGSSAPVPEPASLVLLGLGATALLSRRKNRRRI